MLIQCIDFPPINQVERQKGAGLHFLHFQKMIALNLKGILSKIISDFNSFISTTEIGKFPLLIEWSSKMEQAYLIFFITASIIHPTAV